MDRFSPRSALTDGAAATVVAPPPPLRLLQRWTPPSRQTALASPPAGLGGWRQRLRAWLAPGG